jgi:hypothetical protein
MARPVWIPFSAVLVCAFACRAGAADAKAPPAASGASAAPAAAAGTAASGGDPSRPVDYAKERVKRPAPLKRLIFSAREGFSLRMVSNQDVTAEIRNGAGRTLARTACTLEAGDWTLRPRNLPPGLYTVLLRTGPQLRSMRMKIEDSERGRGSPEWVLEKAVDSTQSPDPSLQRGAALVPFSG